MKGLSSVLSSNPGEFWTRVSNASQCHLLIPDYACTLADCYGNSAVFHMEDSIFMKMFKSELDISVQSLLLDFKLNAQLLRDVHTQLLHFNTQHRVCVMTQ